MQFQFTLDEVRALLEGSEASGDYTGNITGIASLEEAVPGDLSFLSNPKYRSQVGKSQASVLLVPRDFDEEPASGKIYFKVDNPNLELARVCSLVESRLWTQPEPGIHPSSVIDPTAEVDPSATVGPLCYIGPGARVGKASYLVSHVSLGKDASIGEACWIAPHVLVGDYCTVGDRCRLHGGVVLGSDGFGYEPSGNQLEKLPQIGVVVIEDDVEIGANASIDRARFAETRIGAGTKIDNLVQIGHNCKIGNSSALAAQVGLSGSTELGNGVLMLGQSGAGGHLKIGDGAFIAGQTGVSKSVPPGSKIMGTPHMELNAFHRMMVVQRKLPEFAKRIENLREVVESLKPSSS